MHPFGAAGFSHQPLQGGGVAARQAGLADATGQGMAGIGNPTLPAANAQALLIDRQPAGGFLGRRNTQGGVQPGQRQQIGQRPHQQRSQHPKAGRTQGRHQRVLTVRPFQRTEPRSRLTMASPNTPRKNSTGIGKIKGLQRKRPTRCVITSSCRA